MMKRRASIIFAAVCAWFVQGCAVDQASHQYVDNDDEKQAGSTGERGIGGSGMLAGEQGIGGSGKQLGDGRGIGGSGMLAGEQGIGGSGIRMQDADVENWLAQLKPGEQVGVVGTISDFGSIWVNGLHIEYEADTPVTEDGRPIQTDQMSVGQRVLVTAGLENGVLQAQKINLIHEVVGPVTQYHGNSVVVMGQKVVISEATKVNTLGGRLPEVGEWVEVAGLRSGINQIEASYLGLSDQSDDRSVLLRGVVASDEAAISVAGLKLTDKQLTSVANDDYVVLRAQLINKRIQNADIQHLEKLTADRKVRLLSLERVVRGERVIDSPYTPTLAPLQLKASEAGSAIRVLRIKVGVDQSLQLEGVGQTDVINYQAQPQPVNGVPSSSLENGQDGDSVGELPPPPPHTDVPTDGEHVHGEIAAPPPPATDSGAQLKESHPKEPRPAARAPAPSVPVARPQRSGGEVRPQRPETVNRPVKIEVRPQSPQRPVRPGSDGRPPGGSPDRPPRPKH